MLMMVDSLLLLVLYFDDLLITSFSTSTIAAIKRILHDRFLMMDMGLVGLRPSFEETLVRFDHFLDFDAVIKEGVC
jgi:hypothetical protein